MKKLAIGCAVLLLVGVVGAAEAQARQNELAGAVQTYNPIRVRAGLAPHVLGTDVTTQAEVLAAIEHERRVELAMEGDRWPDLVRTGTATTVLGIPEFQTSGRFRRPSGPPRPV